MADADCGNSSNRASATRRPEVLDVPADAGHIGRLLSRRPVRCSPTLAPWRRGIPRTSRRDAALPLPLPPLWRNPRHGAFRQYCSCRSGESRFCRGRRRHFGTRSRRRRIRSSDGLLPSVARQRVGILSRTAGGPSRYIDTLIASATSPRLSGTNLSVTLRFKSDLRSFKVSIPLADLM